MFSRLGSRLPAPVRFASGAGRARAPHHRPRLGQRQRARDRLPSGPPGGDPRRIGARRAPLCSRSARPAGGPRGGRGLLPGAGNRALRRTDPVDAGHEHLVLVRLQARGRRGGRGALSLPVLSPVRLHRGARGGPHRTLPDAGSRGLGDRPGPARRLGFDAHARAGRDLASQPYGACRLGGRARRDRRDRAPPRSGHHRRRSLRRLPPHSRNPAAARRRRRAARPDAERLLEDARAPGNEARLDGGQRRRRAGRRGDARARADLRHVPAGKRNRAGRRRGVTGPGPGFPAVLRS